MVNVEIIIKATGEKKVAVYAANRNGNQRYSVDGKFYSDNDFDKLFKVERMGIVKVLNLYGGVGGNRKKWKGVHVTTIEKDPKIAAVYQRLYPDDIVIVADAHQYLQDHFSEFNAVWSSPPCQRNSKMIISGRNRKPLFPDLRLYEEAIFLDRYFKGKWVIENVVPYYDPLITPTAQLGRHLFWANFEITPYDPPKFHNMMSKQNASAKKQLMDWLDIHYEENLYYEGNHCLTQVLRNCVHPDLGLHVYNCALKQNIKSPNIQLKNKVA